MSTVVSAAAPNLLRCAHCGAVMSAPPDGMRADVLVFLMARFVANHEQADGTPTLRLRNDNGLHDRPHV